MPVSFHVSQVQAERERLPCIVTSELIKKHKLGPLEAYSQPQRPYVLCYPAHGLLMAAHVAYAEHYPLVLSPDHVWICIAQGLARHINEHAEEVRSRWVQHVGQLGLEVRRDQFKRGSLANDWPGVFAELSEKLREHLGNRRDLFISDFSTTDALSRAVSELVLLGAMKKYFNYSVWTFCGIPSITLEGTLDDWRKLRARVSVLREFDLGWWVDGLEPFLERFEDAFQEKIDLDFWQQLYKFHRGSGGDKVSGWINVLFPYLEDEGTKRNPWFSTERSLFAGLDGAEFSDPYKTYKPATRFHDFSCGLSRAPFGWKHLTKSLEMFFVGGFFGLTQDEDGAIRPQLGWAVTERIASSRGPGRNR